MKMIYDRIKCCSVVSSENCWVWTLRKDKQGYGRVNVNYKTEQAHRVSWVAFRGEIPAGMCVLHKCDNPSCVNPDHLFLGTRKDNCHDMIIKGRDNFVGRKYGNKIKRTHCKRGHSYEGNSFVYGKHRQCKICHKMMRTVGNDI